MDGHSERRRRNDADTDGTAKRTTDTNENAVDGLLRVAAAATTTASTDYTKTIIYHNQQSPRDVTPHPHPLIRPSARGRTGELVVVINTRDETNGTENCATGVRNENRCDRPKTTRGRGKVCIFVDTKTKFPRSHQSRDSQLLSKLPPSKEQIVFHAAPPPFSFRPAYEKSVTECMRIEENEGG